LISGDTESASLLFRRTGYNKCYRTTVRNMFSALLFDNICLLFDENMFSATWALNVQRSTGVLAVVGPCGRQARFLFWAIAPLLFWACGRTPLAPETVCACVSEGAAESPFSRGRPPSGGTMPSAVQTVLFVFFVLFRQRLTLFFFALGLRLAGSTVKMNLSE